MSFWEENEMEVKIIEILSDVTYQTKPEHHFGIPFLSAYQLAIKLDISYPELRKKLGLQIGGRGTNEKTSLAQYIAGQLSQRIKSGEIIRIEGGFFSNIFLKDVIFEYEGNDITSSLTGTNYDLSMYRLIK